LALVACGVRFRPLLAIPILLACLAAPLHPLRSEMTEAEKRRLFLKVREDIKPVPKATPASTPRPANRPKPPPAKVQWLATPTPRPDAVVRKAEPVAPTIDRSDVPEGDYILLPGETIPGSRPAATPRPTPTPVKKAQPVATPTPKPTPKPKPTPRPKPSTKAPDAPIHIEKSGLQKEQDVAPPPKQGGGWFGPRYKYLTPSVRKAIDRAKVRRGRWKYIIIHNSGTRQGNARIFDRYHTKVRKMRNGLAYHFVIGNGSSSGDGEIEIGNRWTRQINGGHVASDYLNNIALGICLVGDLNRDKPTKAQLAALEELVDYLRRRVGKVKGRDAIVKGHKQINPKPTDCPGARFPYKWMSRKFGN
jgi:hypothetical protein